MEGLREIIGVFALVELGGSALLKYAGDESSGLEEGEYYTQGDKIRQSYSLNFNNGLWYVEYDENGHCSFLAANDGRKTRYQWGARVRSAKPNPQDEVTLEEKIYG